MVDHSGVDGGDGDGDGDYQLSPVVDHREFVCLECHPCAALGLVWRWNQDHLRILASCYEIIQDSEGI